MTATIVNVLSTRGVARGAEIIARYRPQKPRVPTRLTTLRHPPTTLQATHDLKLTTAEHYSKHSVTMTWLVYVQSPELHGTGRTFPKLQPTAGTYFPTLYSRCWKLSLNPLLHGFLVR
jgi:hypothetical protein